MNNESRFPYFPHEKRAVPGHSSFWCKENPRIVRGFSISFSGDFPKTKQKTSHDIEYGNAVCKLPYRFIYLGGFLHEIKRVLSK